MHALSKPGLMRSRLYLKALVYCHPYDSLYVPSTFVAVIDTGAEISVVPKRVLEYFGLSRVMKAPPVRVTAFDGDSRPPMDSFLVHFELQGLSEMGRRHVKRVRTSELWNQPVRCAAAPMYAFDEDEMPIELVILGMDFLERCVLNINGPNLEGLLTLYPTP